MADAAVRHAGRVVRLIARWGRPRRPALGDRSRRCRGPRCCRPQDRRRRRSHRVAENLTGTKIAFLVANEGIEQVELTEPWKAVVDAGAEAELIAPKAGKAQAFNHLDKADTFPVNRTTNEVNPAEYDAVVLPGGAANGDQLRTDDPAVRFVREFMEAENPVAAICHALWTVVEADAVRGRTLTSWPSLQTDIRNAGGIGSTKKSTSTAGSSRAESPTTSRRLEASSSAWLQTPAPLGRSPDLKLSRRRNSWQQKPAP
jgi:protease I